MDIEVIGRALEGAGTLAPMRTQATFHWASEEPHPAAALAGLIARAIDEAGFGCTPIEDLDYAQALRTVVGRRNFFLMIGEVDDGVRRWLVSTKSELGIFAYLMGSRDYQEYEVLVGVLHDVLTSIPGLTDLRWYTLNGYNEHPDESWADSPSDT
ncbi:MAG: hypothetical protein ACXW1Y_04955 [Acidimicrobiia bacterium]